MSRTTNNPEVGELIYFPGVDEDDVYRDFNTDYAKQQTPHLVETCLRFGMHPEFVPALTRHLEDTHLVLHGSIHDARAEHSTTRQTLQPVSSPSEQNAGDSSEWARLLILEARELRDKIDFLGCVLQDVPDIKKRADTEDIGSVVIDWVFGEETISAFGNAYYMQKTFGRYMPDFNGHSQHYRTELSLSANWLRQASDEDATVFSASHDYERLRSGFGLVILQESLLARSVLDKRIETDWVIKAIRGSKLQSYGLEPLPYDARKIVERISAASPDEDPIRRYDDYYIQYIDDEEDTSV